MKKININIHISNICLFLFMAVNYSCDLELQKNYDFQEDFEPLQTLENFTAWEWLQTRNASFVEGDLVTTVGQEFNFYVEMIKAAEMEQEFQASGTDKTFILLNNEAFIKNRNLIELLTGTTDLIDPLNPRNRNDDIILVGSEFVNGVFDDVDKNILKKIIQYHIVTTRVEQINTLPEFRVDYEFQTKLPGPDGEMTIQRDERYRLGINISNGLPSTKLETNVIRHNYIFKNGIGHIVNNYVQSTPLVN